MNIGILNEISEYVIFNQLSNILIKELENLEFMVGFHDSDLL